MRPVLECDVCGLEDDSATYVITIPGKGARAIELCTEHAQPLIDLATKAKPMRRSSKRGVATMEEIEAARLK